MIEYHMLFCADTLCCSRRARKLSEAFIAAREAHAIAYGDVAQLGEHYVRNVGVGGSNPLISTITKYLLDRLKQLV